MNPNLRRSLLVLALVVTTIGLALLLYVVFFRTNTTSPIDNNNPDITGLPSDTEGLPNIISPDGQIGLPGETNPDDTNEGTDTPSIDTTRNTTLATADTGKFIKLSGNTLQYYNVNDGRFYRLNNDGSVTSLSNKEFVGAENVVWSPTNNEAVIEFPDSANVIYNFSTETQITLPKHWDEFEFNTNGTNLGFKSNALDADNRWLGVANSDGSAARAIEPLGDNGDAVNVNWSPTGQVMALLKESAAADEQNIYFIGLNGENFKSIKAPGLAFNGQWSPAGDRLLFNVSNASTGYRPQLWIADAAGENIGANRRSIPVNTWVDKCVFSSDTEVLCAVPQSLPTGAGLAPAVQSRINDDIYAINLTTGQQTLLLNPTENISVADLRLTEDKQKLFVQTQNNLIYKIDL